MFSTVARTTPYRVWHLVRSGTTTPDPNEVGRRASAFVAASESLGAVTLLVTRDDRGLDAYALIPAGAGAADAATHLAHSVAARAEEVDHAPSLSVGSFGVLVARKSSSAGRDTQVGSDPSEVARRLVVAMRPGSWVAVTLRKPTRSEVRRSRRWYAHRLGVQGTPVHHSSDDKAVVMSMFGGAADADAVRSLLNQTAAILPGFDVDTKVRIASLQRSVLPWSIGGLGLWAISLGVGLGPGVATLAGIVPAAVGLGIAGGVLPSAARSLAAQIRTGRLADPMRRYVPPRRPKRGNPNPAPGMSPVEPSPGDYPLAVTSFLVGPAVIVGLVSPHSGSSAGTAVTERRSAPAPLLADIGPVIGTAGDANTPVHISAADFWAGVGLIGEAGSGKSAALRSLFAWHCLERVHPTGLPGRPGARNALIVFESKADGAGDYLSWVQATGDTSALIELANPASWAIDIFDVPGRAADKARFIANALVYAFDAGSIQDQSFETIVNLLTAALVVDNAIAADAGLPSDMSPFFYMGVLLANRGDAKAVELAAAIIDAAVEAERAADARALPAPSGFEPADPFETSDPVRRSGPMTDLGVAEERLAVYFGGKMTEASRRKFFDAPRNKIAQLLAMEQWWSPQRNKTTWRQVLTGHHNVILNTGTSTTGVKVDGRITRQMSSLLLYSLRDAIERYCSGWQAAGEHVSVFADELALIAGSSSEVVTWLKNQGRSYGVCPTFAAQYPEQLPRDVRTALVGFSTMLWFSQSSAQMATEAAADLALDGSEWTASDVANLEPFVAVLRSTVGMQRQPSVPVRIGYWEADRAGYAASQGWGAHQDSGSPASW